MSDKNGCLETESPTMELENSEDRRAEKWASETSKAMSIEIMKMFESHMTTILQDMLTNVMRQSRKRAATDTSSSETLHSAPSAKQRKVQSDEEVYENDPGKEVLVLIQNRRPQRSRRNLIDVTFEGANIRELVVPASRKSVYSAHLDAAILAVRRATLAGATNLRILSTNFIFIKCITENFHMWKASNWTASNSMYIRKYKELDKEMNSTTNIHWEFVSRSDVRAQNRHPLYDHSEAEDGSTVEEPQPQENTAPPTLSYYI